MKYKYILFILFSLTTELFAQQPDQSLEPVVVEDTRINPPLEYPSAFSNTIYLDDFLGEYNTSSEVLSLSPGVVVRDFGGVGQLKTISIRGSSNDQVVVFLDGVRLSSPLGGGIDLSTIPIDYLESIEVVRGGASALAGSDAIGGIVNLVSRKTDKKFTSATATYGSFDTFQANLSGAGKLGDLGYFLSYTHSQSNGNFEFESINGFDVERINNEYLSESVFGKLDYEICGWEFTLFNDFYYDDKGVPGLGEFQEKNSNQWDIRNLTALKITKDGLFSPDVNFEAILYNRFDQLKYENPDPTLGVPIDTLSKNYYFGLNSKLVWFAPKGQIVTFATEIYSDILRDDDFNNPERLTFSTYLGDEISLFYNFVTIQPVLRFDAYKTFADDNDTNAELSPKLGVIISPLRSIALKANIGRSYRVPNFGELFFPEQGYIGGNPDLDPETSIDFDVGLVLSHPKFAFEIDYFYNKVDDLILFVFISSQRIEPRNVGDVDEQGIETSLRFRPTNFLELYTAYTYMNGELSETGSQLPGRPKNNFDLRADLDLKYTSLFWETQYLDEIPLNAFPDPKTTESRTTHNFGIKSGLKGFNLTFEIKNLFDNKEVRDAYDFPLPGRSYFVTASYNF